MLKIEQQADLLAKRESLKKLSILCHSISGLANVYTMLYIEKGRLSVKSVLIIGWGMVCVGYAALQFVL